MGIRKANLSSKQILPSIKEGAKKTELEHVRTQFQRLAKDYTAIKNGGYSQTQYSSQHSALAVFTHL
jgi:hypothetical protein